MLTRRTFTKLAAALLPAAWWGTKVNGGVAPVKHLDPCQCYECIRARSKAEMEANWEEYRRRMMEAWVEAGHSAETIYISRPIPYK